MTQRDYQFWVYKSSAGAAELGSSSETDEIFTISDLSEAPTIPGLDVSPLEGKAVGQPWTVNVLDSTGKASAILSDSGGRADILNRFAQVLVSDDGSAYSAIGGGRIGSVVDTYPGYDFTVNSEALTGYFTEVFTTNSCWVFPPGEFYTGVQASTLPLGLATVWRRAVAPYSTDLWLVDIHPNNGYPLQSGIRSQIEDDLKIDYDPSSTVGSFNTLRCRISGVDHGIKTLAYSVDGVLGDIPDFQNAAKFGRHGEFAEEGYDGSDVDERVRIWVVASSSEISTGTSLVGGLQMFSHAATPETPTWVGFSTTPSPLTYLPREVVSPYTVMNKVLAGDYSSSGAPKSLYSTGSIDTLVSEQQPPLGAWRVTSKQQRGPWLERYIWKSYGVMPSQADDGTVNFKHFRTPHGTDHTGAFGFTSTNMREPIPTWEHAESEQVTAIDIHKPRLRFALGRGAADSNQFGCDLYREDGRGTEYFLDVRSVGGVPRPPPFAVVKHDRSTSFAEGVWSVDIPPIQPFVFPNLLWESYLPNEIFDMWGDGAVVGEINAMESCSTVAGGDIVKVTLEGRPNIGGSTRGGTRFARVLSRDKEPAGYRFQYLELGPASQPLAAPTFTWAKSAVDGLHQIDLVVTGGIPSTLDGAHGALAMARTTSSTQPAEASPKWQAWTVGPFVGVTPQIPSTGSYTVNQLPSGHYIYGRLQARAPGRMGSTWVLSTSVLLDTLGTPTSPNVSTAADSLFADKATFDWGTGSDAGYPMSVFIDPSTSASMGSSNFHSNLTAGDTRVTFIDLTPASTYQCWVRHYDVWGGVGAAASTVFETLTSGSTNFQTARGVSLSLILGGSTP